MRAQYKGGTSALFTFLRWYEITEFSITDLKVVNNKGSMMTLFRTPSTWLISIEAHEVYQVPAGYRDCLNRESKNVWDRLRCEPCPPPDEWTQSCSGVDVFNTTVPCQPPQTKDLKMKIEDVTLIDGNRADQQSVDWFIASIKNQEQHIRDLDEIGAKSTKLINMRKEHKANIDRLVELLDAKE